MSHSTAPLEPQKPRIHLVLSGGAVLGVAHVGVLKAIDALDLEIYSVSGTSVGSLIGCLYAAGLNGSRIEQLVLEKRLDKRLLDSRLWVGIDFFRTLMPLAWSKTATLRTCAVFAVACVVVFFLSTKYEMHFSWDRVSSVAIRASSWYVAFWAAFLIFHFAWRPSFFKGRRLEKWVNETVKSELKLRERPRCKHLPKKFQAIATDLLGARMEILNSKQDGWLTP